MSETTISAVESLHKFNSDYGKDYTFGSNFSYANSDYATFINQYLFPKLTETKLIDKSLGNRFNFLAQEKDFIGQYNEEYAVLDTVPVDMNLSKSEELMLKRNYPKLVSKIYGNGVSKKVKFTLNNNDVRLNFATLGDAVNYAVGVYRKKLSDINVEEEREIKAMLLDYSLNVTKNRRKVTSMSDLVHELYVTLLNLQNNSDSYNEANLASGGSIGRYTTVSSLDDILILTTDAVKAYILDTNIANTFQISGIDFSNKIISFDTLEDVYKTNGDIVVSDEIKHSLETFGDYQVEKGDVIPSGTVFTFKPNLPVKTLEPIFAYPEPKDVKVFAYAYVLDVNKIRYTRYTRDMLKSFYNPEYDEMNYWIHYYSMKSVSPFYNNVLITG